MTDPMRRATASLPPTKGEGCVQRFDLEEVSDDCGAEFSGAARLWAELQAEAHQVPAQAGEADERARVPVPLV
jgi:hypothetical protein